MRKVIFGGICMFASVMGVIAMFFVSLNVAKVFGFLNDSHHMIVYLKWYGIAPIFWLFCLLGVVGLYIGLQGVFEKSNLK